MSPERFVGQMNAWLDPASVIQSAVRFEAEPERAAAPQSLVFVRRTLTPRGQQILSDFVERYLGAFRLGEDYVALLAEFASAHLPAAVLERLAGLRFTGTVRRAAAPSAPDQPFMFVDERDAFLDIVAGPLLALADLILRYDKTWAELTEAAPGKVFLRPAAASPFLVGLESALAAAHGAALQAPGDDAVHLRYGAATLVGRPPFDARTVKALREMAGPR